VKDPYGNVQGAIFDNLASLVGNNSIVRRGVVVSLSPSLITLPILLNLFESFYCCIKRCIFEAKITAK
jgi:hypothetical protein